MTRLNALLSAPTNNQNIALACKMIFDSAADREGLSDEALRSLFNSQSDPDIKRVTAQVLSRRGDNSSLNELISNLQSRLSTTDPAELQDTLYQIARTHNVRAADAAVPLLENPDSNVKISALEAIRDAGNDTHIAAVRQMLNDPDANVASLANEVIDKLNALGLNGHTQVSNADIESELPPLDDP